MEIFKNSFFYKTIVNFISWLQCWIENSGIYAILTKEHVKKNEGFFEKILYKIINGFRMIFKKIKLDKIFKGSIFAMPEIWIGFVILLSPILETMQILFLVLAVILSFFLKVLLDDNFKFRYTPMNGWIISFLVVYIFSAITSLSVKTSLNIALLIGSFILFYFVIVNSIINKKELNRMILCFTGIGLIVSLIGIYQYFFAGSFASSSFVDKEMFEDIATRVSGTFDNPNVMGEYLLFVIPLSLSYFFSQKSWMKKIISLGITGIMMIALALTYSRGCYLGIVACLGVFLLLVNLKFILLFLAGIISLPFVLPKSIINRLTSIGNTSDSSTSYRISIWKGAIDMIKDFWYRPIGQGTVAFNKIYPLYSYSGVGAEHTHNLFLQLIIETGIIGIASFAGIIFKFYQSLCSGLKKSKDKTLSMFSIAFISGMTGYLIQSMFDNTWYNNRIILIFWIFIGLAMVTRNIIFESINKERK